jgi:hypothetical protein
MEMRMKARLVAAGILWTLCVPFHVAAQDVVNGPGRYQFRNFGSGSTKDQLADFSRLWKKPWKKVFDVHRYDQTSATPFSSRPAVHQEWDIQSATFDYHARAKPAIGSPVSPIRLPPASRSCPD